MNGIAPAYKNNSVLIYPYFVIFSCIIFLMTGNIVFGQCGSHCIVSTIIVHRWRHLIVIINWSTDGVSLVYC